MSAPVSAARLSSPGRLPDLLGPVEEVAPQLLGACLVAGPVVVRLTEVEAYHGVTDPASHAARGRTPRNTAMYGPAGRAYVYFTYGMHWCLNVVTGPDGEASAVLLRAGKVIGGVELARSRRPGAVDRDLCRGPARLTRAMAVDGSHNGMDLLNPGSVPTCQPAAPAPTAEVTLRLVPSELPPDPAQVRSGPRVGVSAGAATPWRFWLEDEPTVSVYRPAVRRRRQAHAGQSPP